MKKLLLLIETFFWVPVKRRLPAVDRMVRITAISSNDKYVCDAYIHTVTKKWCVRFGSGVTVPGTVIAWRALGRPYNGK